MSNRTALKDRSNLNTTQVLINITNGWLIYNRQGNGIAAGERLVPILVDSLTQRYIQRGWLLLVDEDWNGAAGGAEAAGNTASDPGASPTTGT